MTCEYQLCIYNSDAECIVKEPQINEIGMCESCIIVDLDEKFLKKEKMRQLMELEKRWTERWGDE